MVRHIPRFAMLLALASVGCMESNPRTETQDALPVGGASDQPSVAREVMVSLSLSETHQVEFLKTGDGRYGVSEVGHLDRDGLEKSYLRHVQEELRLAELYGRLAGSRADSRELEFLSHADREIERTEPHASTDSAQPDGTEPAPKRSIQVEVAAMAEEIRQNTPALGKSAADCWRSSTFWSDDAKYQTTDKEVKAREWTSETWTNNGGGGYCDTKISYTARYKTSSSGRGGLVVRPKPGFPDCSTMSETERICRERGCSFTQGICACPV